MNMLCYEINKSDYVFILTYVNKSTQRKKKKPLTRQIKSEEVFSKWQNSRFFLVCFVDGNPDHSQKKFQWDVSWAKTHF